jgi:hypothetical protein
MLDGFWRLEVTDDRGMAARGTVTLARGVMRGIGELAGLSECHEDSVIGQVDLVLSAADATGAVREERVQLQIQGRVVAGAIAASGADLAEPGRHVALRFEHRSRWAPERAAVLAEAARDDAPGADAARFGAVARIGQAVARAVAASNRPAQAGATRDVDAGDRVPRRRRARLALAIRQEAVREAPRLALAIRQEAVREAPRLAPLNAARHTEAHAGPSAEVPTARSPIKPSTPEAAASEPDQADTKEG